MTDAEERRNRRLALDALENNPDIRLTWSSLDEVYRTDKEFILKALTRARSLPNKSEFERKFPQSLRFDRDVVLAFCKRDDFEELYYERHLFVPSCLTSDKEVMLAYCSKIPRSLQECSEELCDDREVVEAAIALDGLELQYASIRLQEEKEIVRKACRKDGRALEFCPPGAVRTQLTSDRDFMLEVLRKHGGPMLRLVSGPLRHDRELLLEALAHGMRWRFCPYEFQNDKQFLLEALSRKSEIYLELNRTVQCERDIAMKAVCAEDSTPTVHKRAIENVVDLKVNRDVCLAIAKRGDKAYVRELFMACEERFKNDKAIVLAVLDKDKALFPYASNRLRQDPEVLMAAMDANTANDVLKTVAPALQLEHPEIAVKAIAIASRRNLRYIRPYVQPDTLWRNRDVAIAWIRRGNRVLDSFESLLVDDHEFVLEVAEHSWLEFSRVGQGLRADAEFMTEAIDRNGRVIRFAATPIQNDMNMLVRALANTPHAIWPDSRIKRNDVLTFVNDKLTLHKVFVSEFLRGIAVTNPPQAPAHRSQLHLLDRGVETSQAFKKLIAEFLGVPTGEELRIIRAANVNLTAPPPSQRRFHDDDRDDRFRARRRRGPMGRWDRMDDPFGDDGPRAMIALRMEFGPPRNNGAGADAPAHERLRRLFPFADEDEDHMLMDMVAADDLMGWNDGIDA